MIAGDPIIKETVAVGNQIDREEAPPLADAGVLDGTGAGQLGQEKEAPGVAAGHVEIRQQAGQETHCYRVGLPPARTRGCTCPGRAEGIRPPRRRWPSNTGAATTEKAKEKPQGRSIPAWYPNHVWSADTTKVLGWGLWPLQVLVAIDHFSRKVVCVAPPEGPNAGWIIEALEQAM
jgi:hypothetical protein